MKLGEPYEQLVGAVQQALHPGALVQIGQWVEGPDGDREIDVAVRGKSDGGPSLIVIECKDYKRPVGIERIDSLESKRRDLNATYAVLCSNSGFTSGALAKAARVGIGAISVLATGDKRVRLKLTRMLVAESRVIQQSSLRVFPADPQTTDIPHPFDHTIVAYAGQPIANWLHEETRAIIADIESSGEFIATYDFEGAQPFEFRGVIVPLDALHVWGRVERSWVGQVVQVDLTKGTFDHIGKRVTVPPNTGYILGMIDREAWTPLVEPPPRPELAEGEFDIAQTLLEPIPRAQNGGLPPIAQIVRRREVSFQAFAPDGAV